MDGVPNDAEGLNDKRRKLLRSVRRLRDVCAPRTIPEIQNPSGAYAPMAPKASGSASSTQGFQAGGYSLQLGEAGGRNSSLYYQL